MNFIPTVLVLWDTQCAEAYPHFILMLFFQVETDLEVSDLNNAASTSLSVIMLLKELDFILCIAPCSCFSMVLQKSHLFGRLITLRKKNLLLLDVVEWRSHVHCGSPPPPPSPNFFVFSFILGFMMRM